MTKTLTLLAVLLSATSTLTIHARSTLDDIADQIALSNPTLRATRLRINADQSELRSSNNLEDPEISVSPQFGAPGQKVGVEATQSFDWPGVYSARSKANQATSRAMDLLEQEKEIEIKTQIKSTLLEIINTKQLLGLYERTLLHIDSMISAAERAVAERELSRLDLNKLRIERTLANRRLNQAALDLSSATSSLQTLAGSEPCQAYIDRLNQFPMESLRPLADYLDAAVANNPSLRYAAARQTAADLNKKVVSRSKMPGFTLGYTYEYDLGDHYNGFTFGMTLPFFSNRHKSATLNAEILALDAEKSDLENTLTAEIRDAHAQITRLDNEINQYTLALTDGDNLRLLNVAYNAHHITLLEYLQDYTYFLDAHQQLIDLHYQRELLYAKIAQWL